MLFAGLIVLGGYTTMKKVALTTGPPLFMVLFRLSRADASQEQTDVESFAILEPKANDFHNYLRIR